MQVSLVTAPFDSIELLRRFAHDRMDAGALASFTGYCRATGHDGEVSELVLEHYPGFTEREIGELAASASQRHKLIDLIIVHRAGGIAPGEAIVLVAAVSSHRADAFAAVEEIMDYLKTDAPFWKRERGPAGERWVEPTDEDRARRARFERNRP